MAIALVGGYPVGHAQILQGIPKPPRMDDGRPVALQQIRPVRNLSRVPDGERGEDGHADRVCDGITLPQSPVAATDRNRAYHSDQHPRQSANGRQGKNFDVKGSAGRVYCRFQQLRWHLPVGLAQATDIGDIAVGHGIGDVLGLVGVSGPGGD